VATRQKLANSTVVVWLTVVVAFFLGGVDIGLSKIVQRSCDEYGDEQAVVRRTRTGV
jgi:hypothetical protein